MTLQSGGRLGPYEVLSALGRRWAPPAFAVHTSDANYGEVSPKRSQVPVVISAALPLGEA